MNLLEIIDKEGVRENVTPFRVGDTVKVHFKIVEGNKERIQVFEGIVISRKNGGVRETFTVRKISFGVGVERVFPVNSPRIDKIEVVRYGAVRRAKLNYIRDLTGKASTKVREKKKVSTPEEKAKKAPAKKKDEALQTPEKNNFALQRNAKTPTKTEVKK